MALYEKRRIVEKYSRYNFYHPSAAALSAMVTDLQKLMLVLSTMASIVLRLCITGPVAG